MKISIITPTLNGGRFIRECIANVQSQGDHVLEHLIADGGSSDGTPELVRELSRSDPRLRLLPGPDRGQSDAMNKATEAARGDVIGILNVDDYYEPGAVDSALAVMQQMKRPGLVVGDCRLLDENGAVKLWNRPSDLRLSALLLGWSYAPFPCNPSAYFYHRDVHFRVGGYDINDHHAMDLDFILSCARRVEMRYVPRHWGNMRLIPGSKTYEDERGPERVAALLERHRRRLPLLQRQALRITRARIDLRRLLAGEERA